MFFCWQLFFNSSKLFFKHHKCVFPMFGCLIYAFVGCVSFAFGTLRRFVPEDKVDAVQGLALTADGLGAVFDVPAKDLDIFLSSKISLHCYIEF